MMAEFEVRSRPDEEARKRAVGRAYAWLAVGIVHVLFVWILVFSQWAPIDIRREKRPEALTWLSLLQATPAPKAEKVKPRKSENPSGTFNPDIIPRIIRPQPEEESNAITDLGLALGRSLACGANSYEYLNNKMRGECKHKPWQFVYDHWGNIVLDARPRVPQADETLRPSDVQAHERNTAPACPGNVDPNAPCLSAIIGGHR